MLMFLLLFVLAIAINLAGNYWYRSLNNNGITQNMLSSIFNPINFLVLLGSLLRDILISVLLIYTFFNLTNKNITFLETIFIVIGANFLFVAQNLFDLAWVYTHKNELSTIQILDYQSFSIHSIFNSVPNYLYHAAVTANLWELAYIFILTLLLKNKLKASFIRSFGLVFLAYGVPLILWMIFATFLQISNA